MPSRTHVLASTHTSKGASRLIHIGGVVAGCLWGLQRGSGRIGTGHAVSAAATPAGSPPCSRQSPSRTGSNSHRRAFASPAGWPDACSRTRLWWSFPHLYYVQQSEIAGRALHDRTGPFLLKPASCWMVGLRRPEDHIQSRGSATSSSCGSSSMFGGCILTESQKYSPQNRARTSLQRWRWCRAALVSGNPLAFAQGSSGLTPEGMRSNGRAALVAAGETRRLEPSLACILLPQSELEDEGIWSKSQTQSSVGVCWFDAGVADTRGQDPVSGRRLANPRQHRGADLHCCRSTAEPFWVPCIRRPSA